MRTKSSQAASSPARHRSTIRLSASKEIFRPSRMLAGAGLSPIICRTAVSASIVVAYSVERRLRFRSSIYILLPFGTLPGVIWDAGRNISAAKAYDLPLLRPPPGPRYRFAREQRRRRDPPPPGVPEVRAPLYYLRT